MGSSLSGNLNNLGLYLGDLSSDVDDVAYGLSLEGAAVVDVGQLGRRQDVVIAIVME